MLITDILCILLQALRIYIKYYKKNLIKDLNLVVLANKKEDYIDDGDLSLFVLLPLREPLVFKLFNSKIRFYSMRLAIE
jgi:hypothetical protein